MVARSIRQLVTRASRQPQGDVSLDRGARLVPLLHVRPRRAWPRGGLAAACWLAVATFLLLSASPSSPQSTGAIIDGTVVDADGGVLPGVVVTVTSSEVRQEGVTDAIGWFSFTGLLAGDYVVTAALPGYATTVSVQTGTTATVPLVLSPNFPPDFEPKLVISHDRSWVVVLGWPFVGVAVVLFGVGLLRRQFSFVLLGSFFAAPFCLYLTGTPRFWFVASIVCLSSITAAWALAGC